MKAPKPLILAIAGPNGAGKSTLREHLLADKSLPFINADEISKKHNIDPYAAAAIAKEERERLFHDRKSFSFETVLSDPVGDKVAFLTRARESGYFVNVHFIALPSADFSRARVMQRVEEGGHDVPDEKIAARFPRVLANLARLLGEVDELVIYDNSSAEHPFRLIARFLGKDLIELTAAVPSYLDFLDLPERTNPSTQIIA